MLEIWKCVYATVQRDLRNVQMFGSFEKPIKWWILSKRTFLPALFTLHFTDICKHMLNCLVSSTFLCGSPELRHPQLAPESPYMLYT